MNPENAVDQARLQEQERQLKEAKLYFGYSEEYVEAINFIEARIKDVNERIESGENVLNSVKQQLTNLHDLKKQFQQIKLHFERGKS